MITAMAVIISPAPPRSAVIPCAVASSGSRPRNSLPPLEIRARATKTKKAVKALIAAPPARTLQRRNLISSL